MAGLAGYRHWPAAEGEEGMRARLSAMLAAGPRGGGEADGVWLEPRAGVAFGGRTWSDPAGRFALAFDGDIYNAEFLRAELAARHGAVFRGASAAEIIPHACAAWGTRKALARIDGGFALALWDSPKRRLTLARDRLGMKPLCWARRGDWLLFGSTLDILRAHGGLPAVVDRAALADFLRYGYVPAPRSIYTDIRKLAPGHFLEIAADGRVTDAVHWDARRSMAEGAAAATGAPERSDDECLDELERLLNQAIDQRLAGDGPTGVLLSGGIDSSLVAALAARRVAGRLKTFCLGFPGEAVDEAPHARAVAGHLGADHAEIPLTPRDALALLPRLPEIYDEPFADASQLPTCFVCREARREVRTVLLGDGGDELFAGYSRYFHVEAFLRPGGWGRRLAARLAPLLPAAGWDRLAGLLPAGRRPRQFGRRLQALHRGRHLPPLRFYETLALIQWPDPAELLDPAAPPPSPSFPPDAEMRELFPGLVERLQAHDILTYLPGDLLVKVDRSARAAALGLGSPLLDPAVFDFAWRLPRRMRIRDGRGKWLLRRLLARRVPPRLTERPKRGFGVPLDKWLRGPLRPWAEDTLSSGRSGWTGHLREDAVMAAWRAFLARRLPADPLWTILMFCAWRRARSKLPRE